MATSAPAAFPAVADQEHLHNAHVVTDKVISGAQPEGEASFAALQKLGVKSIISVDGAKPDVETARKYGMRYVHLPITYGGVTVEQGRAIAKAIDVLPGKVYVHCHHGKHRSAAAVAVACVNLGAIRPGASAEEVLKTFGTGENYKGLWQAARDAQPMDPAALRDLEVALVETAKLEDYAETMVKVDEHWEHLKQIQKAGWRPPADHPDLDPAHEALQVQELLHEGGRLDSGVAARPPDFGTLLSGSESAVAKLAATLRAQPIDPKAADAQFKLATESCTACHKVHRD